MEGARDSKGVTKNLKFALWDLQLVPTVLMVPFYTAKKLVLLSKRLKTANM